MSDRLIMCGGTGGLWCGERLSGVPWIWHLSGESQGIDQKSERKLSGKNVLRENCLL